MRICFVSSDYFVSMEDTNCIFFIHWIEFLKQELILYCINGQNTIYRISISPPFRRNLQRENHGLLAIAFYAVENKLSNLSSNVRATIYNNEIALRRHLEVWVKGQILWKAAQLVDWWTEWGAIHTFLFFRDETAYAKRNICQYI